MDILHEAWHLLRRDLVLEWRSKYALSSILLYVLCTVFIIYSALTRLPPPLWNAIFWVIILFTAISVVVRSFVQESGHRKLYYYQLANPIAVLLAKVVYNFGLLFLLSLLIWAALSVLTDNPIRDSSAFLLSLALGSLGLSITLTFVAAIAAQAENNATLMAILGFPVIIPILLTLIRLTAANLGLLVGADTDGDLLLLIAIDLLLLGVSLVLFPILWRE